MSMQATTPQNNQQQQRNAAFKKRKRIFQRRKVCRFCMDSSVAIDYKQPRILRQFITERGKIIPRRISGTCAKHQRSLTLEIKRARAIALLPFVGTVE